MALPPAMSDNFRLARTYGGEDDSLRSSPRRNYVANAFVVHGAIMPINRHALSVTLCVGELLRVPPVVGF